MEFFMFLRQLNVGKRSFAMRLLLVTTLWLSASVAVAADSLLDFSNNLKSFRASFAQTVYDADSVVLQESSGTVVLARPGRFKWTYEAPVNQVIVADGLTLWVYDEEIKQVTRQPQSTTLGSAPIGLLSGQRDLASEFAITELGVKDDLEWFQLRPLVSDTDFNEIFIAIQAGSLHAMELRDNFDQATQIIFSNFEKNIALDNDLFTFVVPEGVDVVGEGGEPQGQDELLQDDLQPPSDNTDQVNPEIAPDPLLIDDATPQVEDTAPLATQPVPSDSKTPGNQLAPLADTDPVAPADSSPADNQQTSTNSPATSDAPAVTGVAPETNAPDTSAPEPDELLEDITTQQSVDTPTESAEETVDAEPAEDTTNPSREITFEELKVTE
jgi:outer membrane lipoprotein carrier protein